MVTHSTPTPASGAIDSKPYVEYDPRIGYRYVAGTRRRLPRPGGGEYEVAINAAGIRSDREYQQQTPRGVFRILVLGDSYAAGQFVSNDHRFSELLERRAANLEVINFALEGTGTDQQLLIYEEIASEYEHDVVMLFPFLQNIRRNLATAREAYDARSGQRILRPKPRFELRGSELLLTNSPVPESAQPDDVRESDEGGESLVRQAKTRISHSALGRILKSLLFAVRPWEPFPEYRNAASPGWLLMEAILKRLQRAAAPRPLVIVPLFYDSYVRFRMARNYWDRFRAFESAGAHVIDLLPHFRRLGPDAVKCFQVPHDCHFSSYGHLVVADALLEELGKRKLLG